MQAFPAGPPLKPSGRSSGDPGAGLPGVFIDLARAQPSDSLSPAPRKGHWRTIPWKARNGSQHAAGTILYAGPETNAPAFTIDPQLKGPHEIFIGLPTSLVYENPNALRIKFDNDPCYVPLGLDGGAARNSIQDCRFRAAEMTGRSIQIATADLVHTKSAAVAYIRAVPIAESRLDKNQGGGARMVALNDGFSYLWERGPCAEDRLWEEILPYRDSGYKALQFCITGADHCNYPTKVGTLIGDGIEDYPRVGDRYYTECVKNFFAHGIDPVASTMKFTRSIGLEYHLALRVEAFDGPPAFDYMFRSKFSAAHPELRCIDRDGRKIIRMSYAFPEVREHMLAIVDELAQYKPEGINFIFPRANPYVMYEEPFLREFRQRHGTDARKLPEFHPDVVALRCDIINRFIGEVRRHVPKPMEFSAIVLADRESNYNFGLDVINWVRQGLVDEISPSVWNGAHAQIDPHIGYLVDACRASHCRLVPNMLPRKYSPSDYIQKAQEFFDAGAQGISMWDLNGHHQRSEEWALLKAVGHLPQMPDRGAGLSAIPQVLPLTDLADSAMDRYPPSWAF